MYKEKSQAIDKTTKGEQLFNLKSDFKAFTNRIFFLYLIRNFFFRNNRITSEGAVLIGKGVSVNETLTTIRVSTISYLLYHSETF